jgi:hypothetical protein
VVKQQKIKEKKIKIIAKSKEEKKNNKRMN